MSVIGGSPQSAWTRSPSPTRQDASTLSATELTPRSKIKAMLQAIDADSDKENHVDNLQEKHCSTLKSSVASQLASSTANSSRPSTYTSSSECEVDSPRRPRTGIAARMLQQSAVRTAPRSGTTDKANEDAYARVRRQLLRDNTKCIKTTTRKVESDETRAIRHPSGTTERSLTPIDNSNTSLNGSAKPSGTAHALHPDGTARSNSSSRTSSPQPHRQPSDLFMSPMKSSEEAVQVNDHYASSSESERVVQPKQSRLQELLARKREERLANERAAHRSSSEDQSPTRPTSVVKPRTQVIADAEDDEDPEASKRLTREARPTRKASKKALEELNRETQRIHRNMQLTHQARTKKKFTTADFFKKMNFRQQSTDKQFTDSVSNSSGSAPHTSDTETAARLDTPPSSPPSLTASTKSAQQPGMPTRSTLHDPLASDDEFPSLEDVLAQSRAPIESDIIPMGQHIEPHQTQRASLRRFAKSAKKRSSDSESEDELEILPANRPSRLAVLDKTPKAMTQQDSRPLHALRALAHLNSRNDTKTRKSMTPAELTALLQRKGREQALIEKKEKIESLRQKGVIIQTDEQREHDQMQLENMLERARQEAKELAKREKDTAKAEGRAGDDLPDSEDEDADFVVSDEDGGIELSGSDDEATNDKDDESDNGETGSSDDQDANDEEDNGALSTHQEPHQMIDDAAEEDDADDEDEDDDVDVDADGEDEDEDEVNAYTTEEHVQDHLRLSQPKNNPRRRTVVVSDDEDEIGERPIPKIPQMQVLATPKTRKPDLFGFHSAKSNPIGLSQVFAGTMADTEADSPSSLTQESKDEVAFLPGLGDEFAGEADGLLVQDSQVASPQVSVTQCAVATPSLLEQSQTPRIQNQMSVPPLPSPDVGFQTAFSPANLPTATQETVTTMMLSNKSPDTQRKGRLHRGRHQAPSSTSPQVAVAATPKAESQVADETTFDGHGKDSKFAISANAFDVMKRATVDRPAQPIFNKKASRAVDMVEERAEESDDEYAGLGGVSDDDSQGELDDETKKMIDDESNEKINEREMAAFHADNERMSDEKMLSRLYKDIANGGFRKRHGVDVDFLGSDDEEEAAARRRAAKQREFAKMRKALLADEKVGKIAENPKRQAFLEAIEDRLDGDDWLLIDEPESALLSFDSHEQAESTLDGKRQALAESTADSSKKRKHDSLVEAEELDKAGTINERRRTKMTKPSSLADIRNTLSEIIGHPTDSVSEIDGEDNVDTHMFEREESMSRLQEQDSIRSESPPNDVVRHRRTPADPARTSVIDRMALKRERSSTASNQSASTSASRLAFQHPSRSFSTSFKVPSLLRRATTNASNTSFGEGSSTTAGVVGLGGMSTGKEHVKMGGTKKSSVNYYVREEERRKKVREAEGRREEERKRLGALRRREGRKLGAIGGGSFG